MKAIVMAGGEGTRLRPITSGRPKPMAELFGKPVLEHTVNLLKKNGITDICFTLRYLPSTIEEWFADGAEFGVRIETRVEKEPLGTAGGVRACLDFIGNEDVLIMSGDAVCDFDLNKCIAFHKEHGADATLVLYEHPEPLEYGLVVTNAEGRIERFVEKPGWEMVVTDAINTGIYILSRETVTAIPDGQQDFGKDIFPRMLADGRRLYGISAEGYWCDIGSPEAYRECCMDILSGKTDILHSVSARHTGVLSESKLPMGISIAPPVWIGKNCVIEIGASIGPNVVISDGSYIAKDVVVADSVVNGASIGREAEVCGAIIGRRTIIGEKAEIEEGAVLGDGVNVGNGALVISGVKIWPEAEIPAGARISEDISDGRRKSRVSFDTNSSVTGTYPEMLSPVTVMRFGNAMAPYGSIGVGHCGKEASQVLASAFSCGVCGAGGTAVEIDACFLSEAAFACELYGLDGGVFIGQSDVGAAITFFGKNGKLLDRGGQRKIEGACVKQNISARAGSWIRTSGISQAYFAEAKRFAEKISDNFVVCVFGTGAENRTLRKILMHMGCNVLQGKRLGIPCFSVNRGGQGLTATDEENCTIGEERMLSIAAFCAMENGVDRIYVSHDAPAVLEDLAEKYNCRILRSGRDGEPDDNLYSKQRYMRDGIFMACHILEYMIRHKTELSMLNKEVPGFACANKSIAVKQGVARAMRELASACAEFAEDMSYGLSINSEMGHVRIAPCNNGHALLIRSEGCTEEIAEELCADFERRIAESGK